VEASQPRVGTLIEVSIRPDRGRDERRGRAGPSAVLWTPLTPPFLPCPVVSPRPSVTAAVRFVTLRFTERAARAYILALLRRTPAPGESL